MLATVEQHRGETMRTITTAALLGTLLAASNAIAAAPAKAEKTAAKKQVYDEKADAKAAIEVALAAARRENRRVLIQWGGNWCSWCLLLHDRFEKDADLAKKLRYEYDVVAVDVGKMDKNLDLAAKYGADFRKHGVPYLTVLDADGKPLANQPTDPFETKEGGKNGHDPKKLLEFLTTHQARPLDADKVLSAALAEAAKTERAVFLHFGAPWCGWCLKLDAWLLRPEVTGILHKDFVDVKIDRDRMTGGKEVLDRYHAGNKGGIPWFVFLDGKGKEIITSDGPKGNIGFPAQDYEIDHFVVMLKKARRRITDREIDDLRKTLTPPAKAPAG
jgi:thiol-disulfide isomerase/thioredoxin